MGEHTIEYRGYQIDPVKDPYDVGNWEICPVEDAEVFEIYPPDINRMILEVEAYTLETAKAAVDLELDG